MLLYCLAIIAIFVSSNAFAQQWRVIERAPMPEPVTNNAVVEGFIGDTAFVYSFGGLDSTKTYSGIHLRSWRYNTVADRWELLPPLPDEHGKIAAAASRIGDVIYIIGGYHVFANGSERSSNKVHRFDIQANQFLADGAPIPVAIDDHAQAVWRDSLIYVVTGWSNTANVPNVQIYNPAEDRWMEGTPVPTGSAFESFGTSGVILGDTIFYYGGASFGPQFPVQNTLRKGVIDPDNPTMVQWSVVSPEPTVPGYRTGAIVVRNQPFWLGGSAVTYNYDGVAYDGGAGVEPAEQGLRYDAATGLVSVESVPGLPMDIRGVASVRENLHFIVGGMESGQRVSRKTLRVVRHESSGVDVGVGRNAGNVSAWFNPEASGVVIEVKGVGESRIAVEVYTMLGGLLRRVERMVHGHGARTIQEAFPDISSGVYFVRVKFGDEVVVRPVVVGG